MADSEPSLSSSRADIRRAKTSGPTVTQRVDGPHVLQTNAMPSRIAAPRDSVPPDHTTANEGLDASQHTVQAEQLGAYLRQRQRELDHREAQLNSLTAKLESDARAARLWLSEQESDWGARCAELARQQEELSQQQRELDHWREAVEAQVQRLKHQHSTTSAAELAAREESLCREAESLAARKRQLDETESRIQLAELDAAQIQEELTKQQRAFQEEVVATRRQMDEQQQAALVELDQKREAVRRRGDHVDHCRAALVQLRGELERAQRETLELRLATEELWTQLSSAAPPAALTRSLGQLRVRLADHYRAADAELVEQKRELEDIRAELAGQYDLLMEQKQHFQEYVARQQEAADQQATRLIAREQQLCRNEAQLREESCVWHQERAKYQQEIRQLRAERARQEEAALLT